jgi:hypothetical protein
LENTSIQNNTPNCTLNKEKKAIMHMMNQHIKAMAVVVEKRLEEMEKTVYARDRSN